MTDLMLDSWHKIFKAIGNKTRLEILNHLKEKELSVGEVEKIIGISQSALSQHLAILREAGIVVTRREAQTIFYSIMSERVLELFKLIEGMEKNRYK